MRKISLHKTDIILNRKKLRYVLDKQGMSYDELHERVKKAYGLDITYKGFMSLLSNRSSWKLLYAHAITDVLGINTNDIFDIINIDTDKKLKEKKEWQEKYQNR